MATKNKIRFNAIDVFIIIALIGCIVGLVLRYQLVDLIRNSDGENNAIISFRVSNIQEASKDYINDGDKFFIVEGSNKLDFGTVKGKIDWAPSEVYNFDNEGNYVLSSKTGRIDVRGKVLASGMFTDEGFLLGDTKYIAPGSSISVQSSKIEITIQITDISPYSK